MDTGFSLRDDLIQGTNGILLHHEKQGTCICGESRSNITHNIYRVLPYHDHIHAPYYYRCARCGSFSALTLSVNDTDYATVPIDAFSIPDAKRILNRCRIDWIRRRIGAALPYNPVVYDLGSGEGCFTSCLLEAMPHARVAAVETDLRMPERFAAEYAGANFVPQPIERFLEQAGSAPEADLIILTDVLEHVLEPPSLLMLVAGALKPTGFAYITLPNADSFDAFAGFPHHVPEDQLDPALAALTSQHLWMIKPKMLNALINQVFEIREMSRSFEIGIRRDSDYSTFLVQRFRSSAA